MEIPKNIKDKLNILPVKWIDEVFELALQYSPVPTRDKPAASEKREAPPEDTGESEAIRPH